MSLTLDSLMDAVGIPRVNGELRAQAATPYLSGVPDRDSVTLLVRAIDVVVTPLIKHRLLELGSAHAAS